MRDAMLSLYHQLPSGARSVAASLRGLYLRHWREGPEFARHVEEALDRETWSVARLRAWREERLARILHRAATRVPYYRDHWAARRRHGDHASHEVLEHWPVLEKDAVRATPRAFLADDRDPRRLFHERTSGTTGKPLDVWRSRDTLTELYALAEARTLRWHGIPTQARYARLGGQLVVPSSRQKPPFWVWNAAMGQLYMSTYHLSPALIPHYLDALARYRVRYLAAYTSSAVALAHEALRLRRTDLRLRAVFTNAEGVDARQRALIEEAFGCRVFETYGQAEMVAGGSTCAEGALHLWPETGHVEVWDGDARAGDGQLGELVCTGLLNPDMPLIRYRVGDRGAMASDAAECTCGRALPRITSIEGRTTDLIRTPDGRRVFWLNPVFYGLPLRESQIEQLALDALVVRIVPADGWDAARDERTLRARLHDRVGPMAIDVRVVPAIPRTANGKLRAVISQVGAPAGDGPSVPGSAP